MELGLGTVQFGLDYGVANREGRTSREAVRDILARASVGEVRVLDTAPSYGEAEVLLGKLAPEWRPFRVVTKTPPGLAGREPGAAGTALLESLARLRRRQVAGLLVHDVGDLLGERGPELFGELTKLKAEGLVERIGASVYDPEQADALLARYELDLLQLPVSPLDQRALSSGLLERLAATDVEVHARSIFLQGLLLMRPDDVPEVLPGAREAVAAFRACAESLRLPPIEAALGFVRGLPAVDVALCGVANVAQLDELLSARQLTVATQAMAELASSDPDLVDPSRWPELR